MSPASLQTKNRLAWFSLLFGLALSVGASFYVKRAIEEDAREKLVFVSEQITLKIQERLQAYELVLRGGVGLFASQDKVSREAWRQYVQRVEAGALLPGVQGIGFARQLAPGSWQAISPRFVAKALPITRCGPPDNATATARLFFSNLCPAGICGPSVTTCLPSRCAGQPWSRRAIQGGRHCRAR